MKIPTRERGILVTPLANLSLKLFWCHIWWSSLVERPLLLDCMLRYVILTRFSPASRKLENTRSVMQRPLAHRRAEPLCAETF